jgi:hypothetical protein
VGVQVKCEQELEGGENDCSSESGEGGNWAGIYGRNFTCMSIDPIVRVYSVSVGGSLDECFKKLC